MSRTRQSISPNSRITRLLLQIVDKPSLTASDLSREAAALCSNKEQMLRLTGALQERGYIERVHTVLVTDEAREVVAKMKAKQ